MAKGKTQQQSAAQRREKQREQRAQRLQGSQDRIQAAKSSSSRRSGPKMRRRSWNQSYMIGIVLLLIAAIIVAFVFISRNQSSAGAPTLASSQVFNDVTKVDPNILAAVGTGSVQDPLKRVQGSPASLIGPTGKPEILYIGAEYCPYCAAQRWPMVVALSRFGTFSQLYQITSSSVDIYPNTPTFTFYSKLYKGPLYTSKYIDFVAVEETGNIQNSSGVYPTLQTPTTEQQKLFDTYDTPPYIDAADAGSIPFVDVANKFISIGVTPGYSNQDLQNMQWSAIASSLADSSSSLSKGILGAANYLTAGICIATGQQPASVCSTDTIQKIEQTLNKLTYSANGTQIALNEAFEADLRRAV